MSEPVLLRAALDAEHPALLHRGLADTWWRDGSRYLSYSHGWLQLPVDGDCFLFYECSKPSFFCELRQTLLWDDSSREIGPSGLSERRPLANVPDGLPVGAARRNCRPGIDPDSGVLWTSAGWIYGRTPDGRTMALGQMPPHGELVRGPGTVCFVRSREKWFAISEGWRPFREIRPGVPETGWAPRLAPGHESVAFLSEDGDTILISSRTGLRTEGRPGVPIDAYTSSFHPDSGRLMEGPNCVFDGALARSVAITGKYLGGPAGAIWDMGTGEQVARALPFEFGMTGATGTEFVSINWETGAGCRIPLNGDEPLPISVPLAPEDALDHMVSEADAVWVVSVMGEAWRICGGQVESANPPPKQAQAHSVPFELSRFGADNCHVFRDTLYGWNEEGLLLTVPT